MASTFGGLEIGIRGLMTQQKALDITGQNMANASTPGYTRQRAEIATTAPYTDPSFNREKTAGQMGTGVEVTEVTRVKNQLIDSQIQQETITSGYWGARQDILGQAEQIINEPSDSNIRTNLDQYWTSLQALSNNTDANDLANRSTLRQNALTMTSSIRQDYASLKSLRDDTNNKIVDTVTEINGYADQINDLNKQISEVSALGDSPNDLLDKRDQLVEQLAKDVNISTNTDKFNKVTVAIGGIALISDEGVSHILTVRTPNDPGMVQLQWSSPKNQPVAVTDGALGGYLQIRDQDLPQMMTDLNNFASTLITQTNAIHSKGYGLDKSTGINFFSGTGAADIDVSSGIQDVNNGLNLIAASSTLDGLPGNHVNAQNMSALETSPLMVNNTTTMGDYLGIMVADLGERSQVAQTKTDHQTTLLKNLDDNRQSVSGVNMDEETANMVKFQQGYNAAAKIISTVDAILDVIINGLKVNP